MNISRREFLKVIGILAASGCAAGGCEPLASYLSGPGDKYQSLIPVSPLQRLILNRISFGARNSDLKRIAEIGTAAYLEEQLSPEGIRDTRTNLLLRRFDVIDMDADTLRGRADKLFDNYDPNLVLDPFRQATLLRQVYSERALYEVMVEFWTDHFNIAVSKGDCWFLKVVDDREVIRKNALGHFRSLLGASAKSPAMLIYLDNQENHRDAPNENYARELLELHTLGVDGGYSQEDVMSLARCLTGWGVKEHFWRGEIVFRGDDHSAGDKTLLGHPIQPAGKAELDQVLDLLAAHPATARYISSKLAQRFLADDPPPEITSKASQVFLDTGGDIQAVLRVILLDGLPLVQNGSFPLKYKRPLNYLLSALRICGADTDGGTALQGSLKAMGQPLYDWPTPDGYPDTGAAWQGNLLPRWRFALDLTSNQIPGTRFNLASFLDGRENEIPSGFLKRAARRLLGSSLEPDIEKELLVTIQPIMNEFPRQAAELVIAGLLASPHFQWR